MSGGFGYARHSGPPPIDGDEARLRQVQDLIRQFEAEERAEAERRAAEEARQRALEAAKPPGLTLGDLRAEQTRLLALIADRDHHMRQQEECELLDRRIDKLTSDVEMVRGRLAVTESELAAAIEQRRRLG